MTVTVLALIFTAAASGWTPTREQLKDRRQTVQTIRQSKCLNVPGLNRLEFGLPGVKLLRRYLVWGERKERVKGRESQCLPTSVAGVIRYVFGGYGDQAVAVASCESGLSIYATNGQYLGLFQMGQYARARYGHSWTAIGQSQSAYAYFRDSGSDWSPWSCKPW